VPTPDPIAAADVSGDDLYGIFYTGGTTAASKGVMLSHGNIVPIFELGVVDYVTKPIDPEFFRWRVGALVRQADRRLLEIPLLAECLPHVGHFVTRNRGSVGGSIAHADAAAELPLALTALGGSVVTSAGRTIPAEEFFVTHFTTALEPGELLVETIWPAAQPDHRYAFEEFALRHGDFALCMAAAVAGPDGLRVALGSVPDHPTLLEIDPEHPGDSAASQVEPWGTLHASAEYLRSLVRTLVDRVAGQVA